MADVLTPTAIRTAISRVFLTSRAASISTSISILDASRMDLDEVCRRTQAFLYSGRVAVGHVTKLSALPPDQFNIVARRLAEVGVAVTVLPATDLFLMGRTHDHNIPRGVAPAHKLAEHGVTCSVATNNVLNPFTPFGDCSLVHMANPTSRKPEVGTISQSALSL